ncbi:LAQU0S05e06502g1_1 [Lachancea quebecensis]|uniref:rRNA-processing protein EFG1 n=1 Tax=Lachancea quebecensis TaxID=1654605 RepID=A0A0N7MLJ8_9SACH|nr:LAQU0S05e06502g1_1 [Lachancea quebecensis]
MDRKQRRRTNRGAGAPIQLAHVLGSGSNKIKSKIRDIERLLQKKKDVLPDTVLIEKERALEALRLELHNAEQRVKIQNNAKKYHMVRFFERKKALRRYTKAVKEGNVDAVRERSIELCYVVNFPKTEKYIALYPSEEGEDQDAGDKKGVVKTEARRAQFRDLIAAKMDAGTLPVPLKDILKGKKLDRDDTGVQLEAEDNRASQKASAPESEKEDSDEDDFFE